MKRYERYKDSGIEWLGMIPEHWKLSHIKRVCQGITDGAHTSPDMSSDDYPFISVVNLKNDLLDFTNCLYTSEKDYIRLVKNGCQPKINDVLYSKDGTIGETYIVKANKKFVVGSSFIIASPKNNIINPLYLKYYLSSDFSNYLARTFVKGTGIPRLAIFNFNRIDIVIPYLEEQIIIADYLDSKTQLIDRKIELLNNKISYYKELRRSLINKIVCRGLDDSVKLKDSGIDWIGKIPEHWEVKRVKDVFDTLSGGTPSTKNKEYWEGIIPWIPSGKVQNNYVTSDTVEDYISNDALINSSTKLAKRNSILVALTGATCSNVGYLKFDTTINQSIVAISSKKDDLTIEYYFYLLLSAREKIRTMMTGGAQGGINQEDIRFFKILLPPISEQDSILSFIKDRIKNIDIIQNNLSQQIVKLQELRKTLINDVVTGKIKVTE